MVNKRPPMDPDLQGALAALRRAAVSARETARQTDTRIVVVENGQLRHIRPGPAIGESRSDYGPDS